MQSQKINYGKTKKHHDLRQSFSALHASDHPSTQKNLSVFKESVVASSGNTFYEELQSVSYNSDFQMLEAIFVTKRDFGYNGNLCTCQLLLNWKDLF